MNFAHAYTTFKPFLFGITIQLAAEWGLRNTASDTKVR